MKTDMVYLAKGGFWLMLGEIIVSILVFVLAIAYANLLPKETYGTYKYILSLAGILSFFTLHGMNISLIQSIARGYEKVFVDILKIKIKFGFIGSFVSICIALYYYLNANIVLALSLLIVAIFIPFLDSFNVYTALLNGKKNFYKLSQYKIASQFFIITSIILILFLTKNLLIIIFSYFALWSMARIFFYFKTLKNNPLNNKLDEGVILYGKHLSFMGIFKLISNHIDKILLWHFVGPVSLAIYFFATAPVEAIRGPLGSLGSLVLPKLSSGNYEKIKNPFLKKTLFLFLFLLPVTFIYILLSPYIYKFIFPQYLDSTLYSQIFALVLLLIPAGFINQILIAHKKKKELYWIQILTPSVKIALAVVLLPIYGIWGAIYTILLAQVFGLLLNLFLLYKN